jgi:hypothetical protein
MKIEGTPLPPPSLARRREITEQMKAARSYTHLLLPRWPKEDEDKEIGTAVILRAGDRLFALTANHCVRREMALYFPVGEGRSPCGQILATHTREPLDIAVLELENRPDILACHVEQVCIDVPKPATKDSDPEKEPLFWVVGHPARHQVVQATDDHLRVAQIAFGTNLVGAKPDVLALYYHDEGYGVTQDLACALSQLPQTPHGFSGGGVWGVDDPGEGVLFNPLKHVRLYGIQHSWLPESRLLKCVPARVIVEILLANYPHLEDLLLARFPAISEGPAGTHG